MQAKIYIGNTMVLEVSGVQFDGETEYLNDATVESTIKDSNGHEVDGESWPVTLDYVADSDGNYRGVLSSAMALLERKSYDVELTITKDLNVGFWKQTVKAEYRTFKDDAC